jgi:hypothetical protein
MLCRGTFFDAVYQGSVRRYTGSRTKIAYRPRHLHRLRVVAGITEAAAIARDRRVRQRSPPSQRAHDTEQVAEVADPVVE